jgi:hypothetical protein
MPITVKEIRRSRSHVSSAKPTARREYMAWGDTDGNAIEVAVDLIAPDSVNGLVIDSVSVDPTDENESVWRVVYNYTTVESRPTPETLGEEISFDLGSVTINIAQNTNGAAATTKYAKQGETAPDFKGGIDYDPETKQFRGIDKLFETFSFSITRYVPKSIVEEAQYIQNLRDCAFRTNSAPFRGFASGEVLFMGAAGSKRSESDYAITFRFLAGKHLAGLVIGDIAGIAKPAHDHLWVLFEEPEEESLREMTPKEPKAVYVEKLYLPANFPQLLGVSA